jgi:putative FmdB family regulatory protein
VPLYEFACDGCDSKFERLLSFQIATGGVDCPTCGRRQARRLLSTFAAVSKSGSGATSSIGGGCACSTGGGCGCGCGH